MKKVFSKVAGTVLLSLIVVTVIGQGHVVFAAKFSPGDVVEVYNTGGVGLRVRDAPGGNIIGKKYDGERGMILEGPESAVSPDDGILYTWWKVRWENSWIWTDGKEYREGWSAENWLREFSVIGEPTITSSLMINPSKSEYYVGETITAYFTITNRANALFIFDVLTVGGRDPDDQVADFTWIRDVTLKPGESYNYQGTLTLTKVGNYHFFCAYRKLDGTWNPAIPTEGGATNIKDITVVEQPSPPPPPSPQYYTLTISTTVGGTTNPAPGSYLYGIGASVCVTALPYDGYTFDHWELDAFNVGSTNPYQVNMDKDHTLHVVFVEKMIKPVDDSSGHIWVGAEEGPRENFRGYYYYSYCPSKGRYDYREGDPILNTMVFKQGFHVYSNTIEKEGIKYLNYKVYHEGIDISADTDSGYTIAGKDVYAAASGKVIKVDSIGTTSAGKYVWIWHGRVGKLDGTVESDISTRYLHLDTIDLNVVQEGKWIARGTKIGTVGKTGTYYYHLHFEVRKGNPELGRRNTLPLNPLDFVNYKSEQAKVATFISNCPVDLIVTDPDGLVVSKQKNDLFSGAKYIEAKYYGDYKEEDGPYDHDAVVIYDLKMGNYSIVVVPEPEASPTDTFSLLFMFGDATYIIADNVQISDISAEPYIFSLTALEYTISGAVRDKLGNPIPNVLIVAQDALTEIEVASATSDVTGAYAMTVPPSTYNLIVTPPPESGFAPTTISNIEVTKNIVIDIVLLPAETFTLSGKVVDRDGNPVPNVNVYVYSAAISKSASTNEQGFYSMQVPPDSYSLSLYNYWANVPNVPTYFSLYKTTTLNIIQDMEVNFTLQNRYLSGRVVDPYGNPVVNVSIYVNGGSSFDDLSGWFETWATSDNYGNFNVTVFTSSSVSLRATPPTESAWGPVSLSINVTKDVSITVTLAQTVAFGGKVIDRDGNPVPNVNVYVYSAAVSKSTCTDADGSFFMCIPPDSYSVSLYNYWSYTPNVPQYFSLYKTTILNITEETFMTFALQNRYLKGKVVDPNGNAVPDVSIYVNGGTSFNDLSGWFEAWATSDNEGNFNITVFTSSNVYLRATPPSESPWGPVSLTINMTDDAFIIVTLAQTVTFSGLVVDRDGNPIPNINVYVYSSSVSRSAVTDSQGMFSIHVPPDSYSVSLYNYWSHIPNVPTYFSLYKTAALNIVEDMYVTFTLQNRYLSGKVDCEGKPVANVSIYVNGGTTFDDFSGWFEAWATTDGEGKFNITVFTSTSICIRATPPPESIYAPSSITNIDVTDDKMVLIALFYKAGVLPTANFKWSPEIPEVGQTVTFDASTSIPGSGIIIRHKWSFGDGTYAIGKIVTHSYSSTGVYTVTLNVTNSKGLWSIIQKQIEVVELPGPKAPIAKFTYTPQNPTVEQEVTFNASDSYDPDGEIVAYSWDFGDGSFAESKIVTHYYTQEGSYKVTLTVIDNDGKIGSISQTVTVVKPLDVPVETSGLVIKAMSPVDLVVIDPDYLVISKEFSEIPDAVYREIDLNGDGSLDDYIFIPEPKMGQYIITVIPEPGVDPTATYTVAVATKDATILLAEDVPISQIPTEPYIINPTIFEGPPSTQLAIGEPKYVDPSGNVYVSPTTPFTLIAQDNIGGSGVMATFYRISNETYSSDWLIYAEPFNITGMVDGAYEIEYKSIDNAGNAETPSSIIVILDNTPPTTTLKVGEPKYLDAFNNIYVSFATSFTLTAEDGLSGSGVALTFYRIYNSSYDTGWLEYSAPFCLTELADGEYSIDYYSIDNLGKTELTETAKVILDNTPPATTLIIGEPKYISDITYVTPETSFTLEATDTGSGIYSIAYRIYNATYDSNWIPYTKPFYLTFLADGIYTIEYNSTDNVQNTQITQTVNIILFSWNYIFEDTYGRGTILKINIAHKFFQFTTPDKDYGIRKATYMQQCGRTIVIQHRDNELRLITIAVDTKLDFCYAIAWDLQTGKRYVLIDKIGIEQNSTTSLFFLNKLNDLIRFT
jgi:PKD repeat protein/protocatechuate 3,4-dioxygenase beta subunit